MVLQKLKNMGAITDHQIQQLQQLLPAAQQQQRQEQEEQQQAAIVAATAGTSQMPAPPVGISLPQGVPPPQMLSQFQQFNPDMQQPPPPTGMLSSMASWGPPPPVPQPQPQLHQRASPSEEGERGEETDEDIQIVEDRTWRTGGSSRERRRRSRSRSRDRKRGRHSRSRSRDRGGGSRRRRSRSRDRKGSEEERQKRREREKKGLPPIRDGYLSGKRQLNVILFSIHQQEDFFEFLTRKSERDWIGQGARNWKATLKYIGFQWHLYIKMNGFISKVYLSFRQHNTRLKSCLDFLIGCTRRHEQCNQIFICLTFLFQCAVRLFGSATFRGWLLKKTCRTCLENMGSSIPFT